MNLLWGGCFKIGIEGGQGIFSFSFTSLFYVFMFYAKENKSDRVTNTVWCHLNVETENQNQWTKITEQ